MATIASVDIALTANSAQLKRGLDEAERRTQRYTRRASAAYNRLNRTIGRLQAGFFGFAAALGAVNILQSVDAQLKLSQATELTFEQFQRLGFALEQAGVTNQQFARGVTVMSQRITELQRGTATVTDTFRRLGITFEQLDGLNQQEQFLVILDALRNVGDATERAGIAANLFGTRLSVGLGPVLNATNQEILELANGFGGVVTIEDARRIETFNDTMNELRLAFIRLVTTFSPVINAFGAIANAITDLVNNSRLLSGILQFGLVAVLGGLLVRGLSAAIVGLRSAGSAVVRFGELSSITAVYNKAFANSLTRTQLALTMYGGGLFALTLRQKLFAAAIGATSAAARALRVSLRFIGIGILIEAVALAITYWRELANVVIYATNGIIEFYNSLKEGSNAFFGTEFQTTPLFEYFQSTADALEAAVPEIEDFTTTFTELPKPIEEAEERLTSFQTTLNSLNDMAAQTDQFVTSTFDRLADSITDALFGASVSIKDFVRDTLRAFIQLQVRTALFNTGSLFGFGGELPAARQFGGPVNAGQPYIVGERGPELFVPNQGGNITRNSQLGGGSNVTYNINAVDAASFQQLVASDPSFIYNVTERGRRQSGR